MLKSWHPPSVRRSAVVFMSALAAILPLAGDSVADDHEEERIFISYALPGDSPPQENQPGIVPASLLMRDYASWTPAQQRLVSKQKFDEFHALEPGPFGPCTAADPFAKRQTIRRDELMDALGSQPVLVTGHVEATEPAWDFVEGSARTIVHLRVDDVLRNMDPSKRRLIAGDLIYLIERSGRFAFNGGILCSRYPPAVELGSSSTGAAVDDVLLVTGSFGERNQQFLQTVRTGRFPIRQGNVEPAAGGWAEPAEAVTLQEVVGRFESSP